jgi:hypothetical protein
MVGGRGIKIRRVGKRCGLLKKLKFINEKEECKTQIHYVGFQKHL